MHKYYLMERKGRKLVAVGAVVFHTDATCLANAERALEANGFPLAGRRVVQATRAESQKNWGGTAPNMITVEITQ